MGRGAPALLAIFAHPDDESFRPGGTLALLARQGVQVQVMTATRGEAGSCGDPPLCSPTDLPAVRERELHCACRALGILPPVVLGFEDGRLAEAEGQGITNAILSATVAINPQLMISFGPDGLSGHPDHVVVGRCAAEAYAVSAGIAALYTMAVPRSLAVQLEMHQVHPIPDEQITLAVNVENAWAAKRAAMECHKTQRNSTPMLSAPEERQRLFFGREFYVRAGCRNPEADFMPPALKGYLE